MKLTVSFMLVVAGLESLYAFSVQYPNAPTPVNPVASPAVDGFINKFNPIIAMPQQRIASVVPIQGSASPGWSGLINTLRGIGTSNPSQISASNSNSIPNYATNYANYVPIYGTHFVTNYGTNFGSTNFNALFTSLRNANNYGLSNSPTTAYSPTAVTPWSPLRAIYATSSFRSPWLPPYYIPSVTATNSMSQWRQYGPSTSNSPASAPVPVAAPVSIPAPVSVPAPVPAVPAVPVVPAPNPVTVPIPVTVPNPIPVTVPIPVQTTPVPVVIVQTTPPSDG